MKIYLAKPRGFCAGVDRAIEIVDLSLKAYGAPIYVRHEIVHSRHVVNSLRQKGAVFVEELNEVPDGAIVIFSAHGVAKEVWEEGNRRNLKIIDATCPLVIKVHNEVNRDYNQGYELILIGHAGHPEVIGTLGQLPDKFHLVSSVSDVESLKVENPHHLSYVTQTTLSVDECRDIVAALNRRFPGIKGLTRRISVTQPRTDRMPSRNWPSSSMSFWSSAHPTARTPIAFGSWRSIAEFRPISSTHPGILIRNGSSMPGPSALRPVRPRLRFW